LRCLLLNTLSTDNNYPNGPQPNHIIIMPLSKSNSSNHGGSFSADEQGVEISPRYVEEGQDVLSMVDDADDEPTDMTPSNEDEGSGTGKRRHGIAVKALKVVIATAAVGTIWGVTKVSKQSTRNSNTAALVKAGKSSKAPTVYSKSPKGSKSAQPSSQPSFEPSMSPSTQPSNQPSDPPAYVQCGQSLAVAGGGWTLVRHVPAGNSWHPSTDRLAGTETYGDSTDDSAPWSLDFETTVPSWDEFMFATGDCTKWLAATKDAVTGAFYTNELRTIEMSSTNTNTYQATWYNRAGASEDPWVSIVDHAAAIPACLILYGEDSFQGDQTCSLQQNDGANVYVRNSAP
jgi:hypothetical protein